MPNLSFYAFFFQLNCLQIFFAHLNVLSKYITYTYKIKEINFVLPSEIWQMISSVAGSIVGKVFLLIASTNWLLINIWVNLICGFDMIVLIEILEHANYQYPQERNLDKSYWNYVTKLVSSINVDTPVVSWITPETSLSNCHLHSLF